jgi:hypothetical protein
MKEDRVNEPWIIETNPSEPFAIRSIFSDCLSSVEDSIPLRAVRETVSETC